MGEKPARGNGSPKRRPSAENPALDRYLREIRRYPLLSHDQVVELAREARAGHEKSFNRLIECNLRFVVKVASGYRHLGLPLADLIGEGNLGLIDAARRFDPDRGTLFIRWANWSIRKRIHAALTAQTNIVRLPTSQLSWMHEIKVAEKDLEGRLGRAPTLDELSKRLPKRRAPMTPIDRHGARVSRLLDSEDGERSDSLVELLEDHSQPSIEQEILRSEARDSVREWCDLLDDQLRRVIFWRFGLNGDDPMPLRTIGSRINRSGEGVRLLELRAIKLLRRYAAVNSRRTPPLRIKRSLLPLARSRFRSVN